jgi:hypothetical protein
MWIIHNREVIGSQMAAKRLYEGMFLVDSALATADWDGTLAMIENILKRADARSSPSEIGARNSPTNRALNSGP